MNYYKTIVKPMKKYENQTDFAQVEPLLEDSSLPEKPPTKEELDEKTVASKRQRKLFVLLVVGAALVLLFVILVVALFSAEAPQQVQQEQPSIARPTTEKDVTQIDRELQVLKDRLDVIDPTKEFVTVPPVNYNLRLE
jgi:cytoskeletal protein RodZ